MADRFILRQEIIKYLKSKGKLRAVLYHKLLRKFCSNKSPFRIKKQELLSCLILMMSEGIIDVIIPEIFEIDWELSHISDSIYLQEGNYFVRRFLSPGKEIQKLMKECDYFFNSKNINFKDTAILKETTEWLENLIRKYPKIRYKILIYYPKNSKPLELYGNLDDNYNLNFQDFVPPEDLIQKSEKIEINREEQESDLFIIQNYRKKYMCFYITLIEALQYAIMNQLKNEKIPNTNQNIQDLITKFGYYCIQFVNSDWVEISEPNPYRWETYFIKFNLPLKILNLEFKTIRFHKRTFECWIVYRYCIFINKTDTGLIDLLINKGYEIFSDYCTDETIAIGGDHEIFIPCPSIEHFFFIFKYICYYHLFLLFHYSFTYLKKKIVNFKLSSRDKDLYKEFLPVMESLFRVNNEKISKSLVFSYYTLDPDELEILYNKFLVNKTKYIEKKLFKYFLLRCAL